MSTPSPEDANQTIAKLREENERLQKRGKMWPQEVPTPDFLKQPSATTPTLESVDEIALRCAAAIYVGCPLEEARASIKDAILYALAQVREPLVKDTVRLDELSCGSRFTGKFDYLTSEWTITINDQPYHGKTIREAIDAALTGTGEKR